MNRSRCRPARSTEVLVRLALDAGVPVRADRILDDLWADCAFGAGKNTLQSKVSQLRRALGAARADHQQQRRLPAGRRSHARRRAAGGRPGGRDDGTAAIGQLAAALSRSAEGLALFRGDALVDAGDGEWLHPHRERLEKIRVGLLQDNLAARVQLGSGQRSDRRAGRTRPAVSAAREPLVLADHRALPGRPAGRRAWRPTPGCGKR